VELEKQRMDMKNHIFFSKINNKNEKINNNLEEERTTTLAKTLEKTKVFP